MDVDSLIDVQWFGLRKGGDGRGRVWGYFTPKGLYGEHKPLIVIRRGFYWSPNTPDQRICVFWGNVGKTIQFHEVDHNEAFQAELSSKKKNFKEYDYHKILPNWAQFKEEMELYVLMRKLKGENGN